MKKLKLIYNPFSGDRSFPAFLDECIVIFQGAGSEVHPFRSMQHGDIAAHIADMPKAVYDAVVVSGGDGTVNIVLNALLKNGHAVPLGIIPSGTANDFASYLKLPKDIEQAAETIARGNTMPIDVGRVGSEYFINVCGAGFLTNISQTVDHNIKNLLGKFAYYLKGLGQLPSFTPLSVRITNSTETFQTDIYFFIVLNSAGTGGFENLSPSAAVNDGLFDFIALKSMPLIDGAKILLKLPSGDHLNDPNIIYFQDRYIKVEPLFDDETYMETDIDGEAGPHLPIEIAVLKSKINVFI
ncbi:MAG: YegS/Rv2252/BmrU family lipid kinase [Clostridiales bacterium]|jgi:YegS/Rv2252/BmrU family lipid kinase|nr:YegS/Rv2252/BmrU family lipid kinase [Clostridiales bacterium]